MRVAFEGFEVILFSHSFKPNEVIDGSLNPEGLASEPNYSWISKILKEIAYRLSRGPAGLPAENRHMQWLRIAHCVRLEMGPMKKIYGDTPLFIMTSTTFLSVFD